MGIGYMGKCHGFRNVFKGSSVSAATRPRSTGAGAPTQELSSETQV